MKLTKQELANVPGANSRRGLLVELAVDLLINLAESAFEKVIDHVKVKRAERLKNKMS